MERPKTAKTSTRKNKKKILSAIKVLLKNDRKNVSSYKASVDTLRNLLQQGVNEFKAGQVKEHFSNWQKITSDPEVLQNIKGAKIPFITEPKMDKIPINPNFTSEKEKAIDSEIEKLLKKGVIKECEHEEGEYISPIFVSPKKDGGYRLILNLKNLNNYVQYSHFKMETLNRILKLIKLNCYMASLDIKDAYYTIPVAEEFQKYLKFIWKGKLLKFCVLLNGLSPCPRWFTKLLKYPMGSLRELLHILSSYIDDIFMSGDSEQDCMQALADTINLLLDLGFTLHPDKCQLIPSTKVKTLGFIIDSVSMKVTLTDDKTKDIMSYLKCTVGLKQIKIRKLAKLIGKLVAAFPASMYGPLYFRNLEKDKNLGLNNANGNYNGYTTISESSKHEMLWWIQNLPHMFNVTNHRNPSVYIYSDASNHAWGSYMCNKETGGHWDESEIDCHINIKEILAVKFSLKSFVSNLRSISVKIYIDNTTIVAAIRHMGTSHSDIINKYTKDVWEWCIERDIWLIPTYVCSWDNFADLPSRRTYLDGEWMFNIDIFNKAMLDLNFKPDVDLFASRLNKQLNRFVSFKPDPEAIDIDAFSISWTNLKFYAFPPFSCISPCLQKSQWNRQQVL